MNREAIDFTACWDRGNSRSPSLVQFCKLKGMLVVARRIAATNELKR